MYKYIKTTYDHSENVENLENVENSLVENKSYFLQSQHHPYPPGRDNRLLINILIVGQVSLHVMQTKEHKTSFPLGSGQSFPAQSPGNRKSGK